MDTQKRCKTCGKEFHKIGGLHLHVKKSHKLETKEYYEKYYPKKSKLYGEIINFKNLDQYLNKDFVSRNELIEWCSQIDSIQASEYIKGLIVKRKQDKNLIYSLSEVELELCDFPDINSYRNVCGSYHKLCQEVGLKNLFNKKIPELFFEDEGLEDKMKIFVDTREQKPIRFKNSEAMKLDFGDYTSAGEFYDYTYVDRKSEQDLKGTLSGNNFKRFKRELERAREFNSYVFILIESTIDEIKNNNNSGAHRHKLPYIWHNLKEISQEYKDVCQFVFAYSRGGLKKLIPKVLFYGKTLWNVDLQYYINERTKQ